MWLLLALVVTLFCLSARAPREWSSWDSRPLGHAITPTVTPTETPRDGAGDSPRWSPVLPTQPIMAAMTVPPEAETGSEPACPEPPRPELEPLPTSAVALAAGTDEAPSVSRSTEPRGVPALEAALSGASPEFAINAAADSTGHAGVAVEIGPRSYDPAVACEEPQLEMENGIRILTQSGAAQVRVRSADVGPLRQPLSAGTSLLSQWPYPTALAERLQALAANEPCGSWSEAVLQGIERLNAAESLAAAQAGVLIPQFRILAEEGSRRAQTVASPDLRSEWMRAVLALQRRLDVWEQVYTIASSHPHTVATVQEVEGLRQACDALAARLRHDPQGESWRQYLLMADAQSQFFGELATDTIACRSLAKRILLRTDYSVLEPSQQAFLQEAACAKYLRHLRRLATEPIDYPQLLAALERYEQEGAVSAAIQIAAAQQVLRWSDAAAVAELGRRIDVNYRNANLRVSVADAFLERMLPPPAPVAERVDEIFQGAYTTGCSETLTQLAVRLLPSPDSWRIGLVAKGRVAMETQSSAGPATFYRRGNSNFEAAKEVVIHRHGWYHRAAVAEAESCSELTDVVTRLDPVPLVGDLARAIAIERFRAETPAAEREVKQRVTATASDRIDMEVSCRLNDLQKRFREHFSTPLQQLALNPLAVEMRTTERYLAGRYRLAGHHQLAAHTPRVVAPAGSMVQVQVHESALNNLFEQLGWEGRRANVHQFHRELEGQFGLADEKLPEELPENVFVQFADAVPLRIAFQDGRVTLQLALAELSQGNNCWKNFTVRVHYRRDPDHPGAQMIRDQYVELIGKRLHLREQIALRGIFSRVFAQNQPIELIGQRLQADPRLAGLEVDQFEVRDGWLSVSLGLPDEDPVRTAREPSTLQSRALRPAPPTDGQDGQTAIMIRLRSP
ncbi:MAG: hypothetical protein GX575_23165 [Candidatus Anammoximicrobium sp.]|nr:hypothetical protein [Candidatus Anammoximicrobium sp.]